jgi:NHLM bacteriocin system ABC transporter ATP-binding protein
MEERVDNTPLQTDALMTAATALFPIHDPQKVWLVESGDVDLFLIQIRDGEAAGARHHLLRIGQGKAIFGAGLPPASSLQLLAAPTPDSRITVMPLSRLKERLASQKEGDHGAALLEDWIFALSRVAAGKAWPKTYEFLEPGRTRTVKEARSVLPREGVVWVEILEGSARFLGKKEVSSGAGRALFPISASAWLEAGDRSTISAIGTAALLERDSLWEGLQAFHAVALERVIDNFHQGIEKERERLRRRERSDDAQLDLTLRQLASPLAKGEEALIPETAVDDPWLLACLTLGKALHIDFKPHPDQLRGVMPRDPVSAIARASGVRARIVALRGKWWKQDNGPLLGRRETDNKTPVALLPTSSTGDYRLWDPITRTSVAVGEDAAADLHPFAYSFYRPFPRKCLTMVDLIRHGMEGCRQELIVVALMGIATGLLAMALPIITGIVFDSVIPGANRPQLLQIFLLMAVVSASATVFQLVLNFAMLRLEGRMDSSIQAAVWDRLLSLPVPFFRNFTAGDLAMRSLSISAIRQILAGSVLSSLFSGIFSVFSFALLFYYSWKLSLLATVLTLISLAATILAGYLEVRRQREMIEVRGRISGILLQFINGIAKLRVSGTENRAFSVWAREFARQKKIAIQARKITLAFAVFAAAFPVLSSVAIFYALSLVAAQQAGSSLTTGEFLAFNAAFTQFQFALLALGSALVSVLSAIPLYERAQPILETLPEVDQTKSHPGDLSGTIEVNHVSFRYRPDTPQVLRDVSLKLPAGKFVAVVGPSGSGKSTLFRLLLGFEVPESGSIYFDHQDLLRLDIQAVRRQIGVVLQTGRLLGSSLYQNIIGSALLSIEDAWAAARMAGLEEDIKAMPMGMHTVIAEGGGGLSGGQRQRLMIARALVKKPRVLFFDEATSALDNETQAIVSRSLESLQATRIVIAHRLSTIANADYIYLLDRGVVAEEGTYSELIRQSGPFSALARRQML